MNDADTAATIMEWLKTPRCGFSWPTDTCGYDQHIKFVRHKNKNWNGTTKASFVEFVSEYAAALKGGDA